MKTKTCGKCKETKSVEEFSKNRAKKDGLQTQCKQCKKQWYQDNPEYKKQYDQDNKEHKAEYMKQWRKDNPEKRRANKQRRRALKKNAPSDGTWTPAFDRFIHSLPCSVCGSTENIEADHIDPLDLGGPDTARNCMPLCRSCNASKNAKTLEQWIPTLGMKKGIEILKLIDEIQEGKWL